MRRVVLPCFIAALGLGGCATPTLDRDPAVVGPFYTPTNIHSSAIIPAEIRRVVVLPIIHGPNVSLEDVARLEDVVRGQLGANPRFEPVFADPLWLKRTWDRTQFSTSDPLPADFLGRLKDRYAADALLWVELTNYKPYQPIRIGWRMRLSRLDDGTTLWSADELFSADRTDVTNSARRHARTANAKTTGDISGTVLQSPIRFADYTAAALFSTFPPRIPSASR